MADAGTLDAGAIIAELEAGGAIAKRLAYYETRQSQLDLMRLVIRAFNEDALCAAEAGTGVGKSFAYLVPALIFAAKTGERVVISTATITLQQQLFEKDVPLVTEALGLEVKTALVKGRGNFLCRRRLDAALAEAAEMLDTAGAQALEAIAAWAKTTAAGSRSDLPFMPADAVWGRVASEADSCAGGRCPHREACFVLALRREAAAANILIVNHHLLFADIAARGEGAGYDATVVLPPYHRVVIDEAHTIEDAATSFFSAEFSRATLNRALGRLFHQRGARKSGLLLRLNAFAGGNDASADWADAIDAIRGAEAKLNTAALELCGAESVFRFIPQRAALINERLITPIITLKETLMRFSSVIFELINTVERKYTTADEGAADAEHEGEKFFADVESLLRDARSQAARISGAAALGEAFCNFAEFKDDVFWVERRTSLRGGDWALWTRAPVDVSARLSATLFDEHATVICLSATLAVAGRFDYWARRSGIAHTAGRGGERALLTGLFPSPFPYERSVLLAVPPDAPPPAEPHFRDFVNQAVAQLAAASGGSALILFTSFESLESAFAYAAPLLGARGIRCFKQGDDDRSRLLARFRADESSVLFATDSFWEGVDAPGDTLRLVVLCRLPFKTPNDPVFEARREERERAGGNPFMELSVPEAVIKFRQGFGRLIRRSSDRGAVVVLDSRVLVKRYGEIFLRSLPETKTCFAPYSELLPAVERFLSA